MERAVTGREGNREKCGQRLGESEELRDRFPM